CCIAIEDAWAITAVSELAASDLRTGPSGAAAIGGLLAAFSGSFAKPVRDYLGLSADARVLAVATESPSASEHASHADARNDREHRRPTRQLRACPVFCPRRPGRGRGPRPIATGTTAHPAGNHGW